MNKWFGVGVTVVALLQLPNSSVFFPHTVMQERGEKKEGEPGDETILFSPSQKFRRAKMSVFVKNKDTDNENSAKK